MGAGVGVGAGTGHDLCGWRVEEGEGGEGGGERAEVFVWGGGLV